MATSVQRKGYTYRVYKNGTVVRVSKTGRSTQVVSGRDASRIRNKAAGGTGG